jgi:hypothetical protein
LSDELSEESVSQFRTGEHDDFAVHWQADHGLPQPWS